MRDARTSAAKHTAQPSTPHPLLLVLVVVDYDNVTATAETAAAVVGVAEAA